MVKYLLFLNNVINLLNVHFLMVLNQLYYDNKLNLYFQYFRSILISKGFSFLFGKSTKDLRMLNSSLEKAVMIPYKAHIESKIPAWWLRAIATKK